jgi:hypothetical protein
MSVTSTAKSSSVSSTSKSSMPVVLVTDGSQISSFTNLRHGFCVYRKLALAVYDYCGLLTVPEPEINRQQAVPHEPAKGSVGHAEEGGRSVLCSLRVASHPC